MAATHRLNSLKGKLFPVDDMPNFCDHDIRSGKLITVSGTTNQNKTNPIIHPKKCLGEKFYFDGELREKRIVSSLIF